ncbi:MAG TPA: gamma-glutamylcyclotransferase [Nitrososphaeria archaeon]|nr:MAG: hypothetical protein DRN47_00910 [Candidatus Wolframiiraptor sp.]HDD40309.1 gamma-glutamylcyclotransferase [Nitrososphaeria archaeon]
MTEIWYFAYGWSMNKSLMKRCIKNWVDSRRAELKGFRLVFDAYSTSWKGGVANLEEDESSKVYGVAYKIDPEQLKELDKFEGVPQRAMRRSVELEVEGVGRVKAITHVAINPRKAPVYPSKEYVSAMLKGARQHNLGEEALKTIRRAAGSTMP